MKEDREVPENAAGEEPGIEPVEEPEIEAVEAPHPLAGRESAGQAGEEADAAAVKGTEVGGLEASEESVDREPPVEVGDEPSVEAVDMSRLEGEATPKGNGHRKDGAEDSLELDRMEVRPTVGVADEEERPDTGAVEPEAPAEERPARPVPFVLFARHWVWILGSVLIVAAISLALFLILTPPRVSVAPKAGEGVHVVSASLGGEHYVRFNLWGPFGGEEGKEALERSLPKIRHDLILSGARPDVVRSIQENDLYFLEKHILGIVSHATGIRVERLDLKGLSVTRYSDQEEVSGGITGDDG